jgi:Kef-type K+ transport system membrane component KefB/mannitol/fructose-specific phosphotransferase system IIA component (Ntr-type)
MFDNPLFSPPFHDPVIIFSLVILIMLLAPIAFKKLRMPSVVGLIIAGTIIGPGVLGWLERDATIELLGTVGLLYLMFMAGLSLDLNQFEKLRSKSLSFGFVSFIIPQMGGLAVGLYLLNFDLPTSLLLGSIVGSHTLLAYPVAEKLGITKNTGVIISMGGTLVTDVLSLGVLAVVAGSVSGESDAHYWIRFSIFVLLFVAAAVIIIPRLGRWFFKTTTSETDSGYLFLLAVLFSTAFLAELAGLAAIIGAFAAGLLLNRLVPGSSTLMSRVQFIGNALFIPFFLLSVGMLVDISALGNLEVWILAGAFSGLVILGKGIATLIISAIFKFSKSEGFVVYGLTTPQSAATLAVTLIGFDLGLFSQTAVNAVVIMILITCFIGPWLVERYGREVAIQDNEKAYEPSEAPQRLLVPLANPETSDNLMDIALMLRNSKEDQALYPLTVARDGVNVEEQVARGEKILSHAVLHAAAANVPATPVTRVDYNPAIGIARAVSELRISGVVIGWNGERSPKQKIFGTILDQLLDEINTMLIVSKIEKPINTSQRIVIALPPFTELEPGFREAMRTLKVMANQIGDDLIIVSVEERISVIKEKINKIKPDIDIGFKTLDRWADLLSWYKDHHKSSDLFVLLSARDRSVSWRPGLDRLPRVFVEIFPKTSFITLYPGTKQSGIQQINEKQSLRKLIEPDHVTIGFTGNTINEAVTEILEHDEAFADIGVDRIVKRLLKNSEAYTPEVTEGVLLYEAHTSKVEEQMLFIGTHSEAKILDQTAYPVHIILILLSPKSFSAEQHLSGIHTVAQLIQPERSLTQIATATEPEEVIEKLLS